MRPFITAALVLMALAPARAADADPAKVYHDLLGCYVAYEQDKADAAVRGDPARGARREAQIPPLLVLLGQYGQSIGKKQADVQADMRAGMDAWTAGIAAGTIEPAALGDRVAACEAWLKT